MPLLLSLILVLIVPPAPASAALAGPPVAARVRVASGPATRYVWPVEPVAVVRRFDPPPEPWLAGHRGVDLSAPAAAPIRAAAAGTVVHAGRIAGRGVVSVAHPGGLRTTYEPLDVAGLHVGDAVTAGQVLGTLTAGHPGCPAAACLHWGLRDGERYLDPLALMGLGRVRLLPLQPPDRLSARPSPGSPR